MKYLLFLFYIYNIYSKSLILYFSRPNENYIVGNVNIGNTQVIAEYIKFYTNAEILKIKPEKNYPISYPETLNRAKKELDENQRPNYLKNDNVNQNYLDEFDTIYLGFPQWYEHLPRVFLNFLESFKFENKIVYPFTTHEGSGLSNTTLEEIKNIFKNSDIKDGLDIFGHSVQNSQKKVKNWLGKKVTVNEKATPKNKQKKIPKKENEL